MMIKLMREESEIPGTANKVAYTTKIKPLAYYYDYVSVICISSNNRPYGGESLKGRLAGKF